MECLGYFSDPPGSYITTGKVTGPKGMVFGTIDDDEYITEYELRVFLVEVVQLLEEDVRDSRTLASRNFVALPGSARAISPVPLLEEHPALAVGCGEHHQSAAGDGEHGTDGVVELVCDPRSLVH